ncbi:MAG: glycine--tRNA ligase subunit beta [Bryobacteraceae bacterium]|nr:glycine--tRNA ligase subunit beta [Bryobacteraceae bacterium]
MDFLLEIGSEEIPDWMIDPALAHLEAKLNDLLLPLGGKVTSALATPRRLAMQATGLEARQADSEELVTGPPKAANEQAIAGFAKKQGIDRDVLKVVTTARGEFFGYTKHVKGQASVDLLSAALPSLILGIPWPKAMYWTGKGGPRFIRPIRWLVCLLGESVVPFEVAGVHTGNLTNGHRKLGGKNLPVTIDNYAQELAKNFVILSAAERQRKIRGEIVSLIAKQGLKVKADAALEHTLTYITEFPTAILGSFDPSYLALPAEVLVTVMRFHQKYFSVETGDGKLSPHFIAVMNTSADPEGLVRHGNERVLRARFNDARFFYDTDQKRSLTERVEDLAKVTFQAELGSYLDKTNRVMALLKELGAPQASIDAAQIAKVDLTTDMVKEFTELQGQIGGIYARAQGHPEAVAQAIYDQYKPVSMEDSIPTTVEGQYLSLTDKVDTLRGCFGLGIIPKGSSDPLALRRAAQGVVKILVEGELALKVPQLTGGDAQLEKFFADRVGYYFREIRGFAYDEVAAVMAAGWPDLKDALARLEAVKTVRQGADFEPLAAAFKRIKNILTQAKFAEDGAVDASKLEPGAEADLAAEFARVKSAMGSDYVAAMGAIASLRPSVDNFFNSVMVNVEDAAIRRNRLTLLRSLLTEFSTLADFSEIVTRS